MGCNHGKSSHIPRPGFRSSKLHSKPQDVSIDNFTSGGLQTFSQKKLLAKSGVDAETEAEIAALEKAVAEQQLANDECWGVKVKDKSEIVNRANSKAVSASVAPPSQSSRRSPTSLADILQVAVDETTSAKKAASTSIDKTPQGRETRIKEQWGVVSEAKRPHTDVQAVVEHRTTDAAVRGLEATPTNSEEVKHAPSQASCVEDETTTRLANVKQGPADCVANIATPEEAKVSTSPSRASSSTEFVEKLSDQEHNESVGNASPESTEVPKLEELSLASVTHHESLHAEAEVAPVERARCLTQPMPAEDEAAPHEDSVANMAKKSAGESGLDSAPTSPISKDPKENTVLLASASEPGIRVESQSEHPLVGSAAVATAAEGIYSEKVPSDNRTEEDIVQTCATDPNNFVTHDREANVELTISTQESQQTPVAPSTSVHRETPLYANEIPEKSMDDTISPSSKLESPKVDEEEEEERARAACRTPRKESQAPVAKVTPPKLRAPVEEVPIMTNSVRSASLMKSKSSAISSTPMQLPKALSNKARREYDASLVCSPKLNASETIIGAASIPLSSRTSGPKLKQVPTSELGDSVSSNGKNKNSRSMCKDVQHDAVSHVVEKVPAVAETAAQDSSDNQACRKDEEKKKSRKSEKQAAIRRDSANAESAVQNSIASIPSKDEMKEKLKMASKRTLEGIPSVAEVASQNPVRSQVHGTDESKKNEVKKKPKAIQGDSPKADIATENPLASPARSKDRDKGSTSGISPKRMSLPPVAKKKSLDSSAIITAGNAPAVSSSSSPDGQVGIAAKSKQAATAVGDEPLPAPRDHVGSSPVSKKKHPDPSAIIAAESVLAESGSNSPDGQIGIAAKSKRAAPAGGDESLLAPGDRAGSSLVSKKKFDSSATTTAENVPAVSSSSSPDGQVGVAGKLKRGAPAVGDDFAPKDRAGSSLRDVASGQDKARSKKESGKLVEFSVTIHRGGSKLGLEAETNSDGSMMLIIHHVREGPVLEWNRANPSRAIRGGDMIVEVNGVRGTAYQIVPVMEKADPLEMVIRRPRSLAKSEACTV